MRRRGGDTDRGRLVTDTATFAQVGTNLHCNVGQYTEVRWAT